MMIIPKSNKTKTEIFDYNRKFVSEISGYINEVLSSENERDIHIMFKAIDFMKTCMSQEKYSFKLYLGYETRYRFTEKAFNIEPEDLKSNSAKRYSRSHIFSFLDSVSKHRLSYITFNTVKRFKVLFNKIDKKILMQAAKKLKQLKRYAIYFEEHIRDRIALARTLSNDNIDSAGFLDILRPQEVIEILDTYKKLQPEDFNNPFVNSILNHPIKPNLSSRFDNSKKEKKKDYVRERKHSKHTTDIEIDSIDSLNIEDATMENKSFQPGYIQFVKDNHQKEIFMYQYLWKNSSDKNWELLSKKLKNFDAKEYNFNNFKIWQDQDEANKNFELLLSIVLNEINQTLMGYLRSDQFSIQVLSARITSIRELLNVIYRTIYVPLDYAEGEIAFNLKLYLHIVYEIELFVIFMHKIITEHHKDIVK